MVFPWINHGGIFFMCDDFSDDELLKVFSEFAEDSSGLEEFYGALEGERYSLEVLVGEGGAKMVYKACDRVTGRTLARAFPKSDDEHTREEFLREARLHSSLQHPNIIPLYDIGMDDDRPYFSMKYVKGRTIEELVKSLTAEELQLPEYRNEALDIFLKVCDAVAFAHSRKILHLDLKPANIHVSDYGEVLVGDWGLARIQGSDWSGGVEVKEGDFGQFSRYGLLCGTPGYMAPEQCVKGSEKGPFTDIYSLGGLLLYLCSGQEAVSGSPDEKMQATKKGKLNYSEESIFAGLSAVIRKALSLKPEQRYTDVKSLINDINAYRAGYLTSAEPNSFIKQFTALCRRNKTISIVIFAAVVLVAGLTAGFIQQLQQEQRRAVQQEKISREALEKYNKAEKERIATTRKAYERFLKESEAQYKDVSKGIRDYIPANDVRAYHLVTQALEFNSELPGAWALKGKLAMLIGNFNEAAEAFAKAGDCYKLYRKVCLDYVDKDLRILPNLFEMLKALFVTGDDRLINDFIYKTMFSDLTFEERIFVTRDAMKLKNPGDQPLNFKFDPNRFALDISGNKRLRILYMIKNLPLRELDVGNSAVFVRDFLHLERLPLIALNVSDTAFNNHSTQYIKGKKLRELSLRNCPVSNLSVLKGMPLERLDVSGTKCQDFSFLNSLKELNTITCSKNQEKKIREALKRDHIQVLIR